MNISKSLAKPSEKTCAKVKSKSLYDHLNRVYFESREEARTYCRNHGWLFTSIAQHKENSKKFRWSAPSW